jgi:ribosomal-protein-alanine N-acetyltransferase
METSRLRTVRLEIVPATKAIVTAELSGRMDLSREIGADVPISWPPEHFDRSSAEALLAMLEADPESLGWGTWYVVRHDMLRFPIVIGVCGYKGPPDENGTVEIGCSILVDHRRRGYATESTAALIGRAWAFPDVERVVADVLPSLIPAAGTLEKLGFRPVASDPERGTLRYQLQRS